MNKIILAGIISSPMMFSHECNGEKFNSFNMSINRKSGVLDIVHCIVPEITVLNNFEYKDKVKIIGEIRTRNVENNGKKHVEIYVFVNEIMRYEGKHKNYVDLEGFLCKEPVYRTTPLGREITDIIIACNRKFQKSDYIPCIAWGRNAARSSKMSIGTKVSIQGRLQSREYTKSYDDGTSEIRTVYELCVTRLEEILQEDNND